VRSARNRNTWIWLAIVIFAVPLSSLSYDLIDLSSIEYISSLFFVLIFEDLFIMKRKNLKHWLSSITYAWKLIAHDRCLLIIGPWNFTSISVGIWELLIKTKGEHIKMKWKFIINLVANSRTWRSRVIFLKLHKFRS
jgi:hypothetical protein